MTALGERLEAERAALFAAIDAAPSDGRAHAVAFAAAMDGIVTDAFTDALAAYPNGNPSTGERIALVALGGYGRAEMAPFSDVDLMFLVPQSRTPWCEQVIEATLYALWDAKVPVGQAVRTPAELVSLARADMTIRTAMLEHRFVGGDRALYDEAADRFRREVVEGTATEFVAAKLAERDARHEKFGDSRYLVEPNVKNGKGGLRDLHTLLWVGRYVHGAGDTAALTAAGLLSEAEHARFDRALRFFWSVRCTLHRIAGRAEDRLNFALQRDLAAALRYADRPGKSAVERFMQMYFLQARTVGDLTGQFLAQLDDQLGAADRRFALPTFLRRPRRLGGFVIDRGRLALPRDDYFREDPRRLLSLFALAAREQMEIHPRAMRIATRDARLVDQVRDDPQANADFLEVLTSRAQPELVLRWMNEANVFGRFVPDFRRVVAQMQFDMYHHYTVDEHTIRAVGLLAALERGEFADDHPLATALFRQIASRRVLYVAVLLHDIAKGRKGDHSILGEEVARALCPRFGLDAGETDLVAWLVRHHLLMSRFAFKRDLADPKTIDDFAAEVQSPERLRLLLLLTVVDIRAVGPGVWTEWKRGLLSALFDLAEQRLRLGYRQRGRSEEVAAKQASLAEALGWDGEAVAAHAARLPDSYWLAEPADWTADNARQMAEAAATAADGGSRASIRIEGESDSATRVSILAPDRPGLFYRICAGLAAAGASIIGARIHTTRDGMALDNLLVQDAQGRPYHDRRRRSRLERAVAAAIEGADLPASPGAHAANPIALVPSVTIAENASRRFTVVEVRAVDRPGLLAALALAILRLGHVIHSAHIATYGEKAVDVFYLTAADGEKLDRHAVAALRPALLAAAEDQAPADAA